MFYRFHANKTPGWWRRRLKHHFYWRVIRPVRNFFR